MKVLLAIDSSEPSQNVPEEMARRPWPSGTTFCVLHIVDMMRLAHVPALVEDAKRSAHALVNKAADKLARSGHEAISDVLLAFPRKAITTYARE